MAVIQNIADNDAVLTGKPKGITCPAYSFLDFHDYRKRENLWFKDGIFDKNMRMQTILTYL